MLQETESPASQPAVNRLIDVKEVCALTGSCRSWVHEMTTAGRFPQPIRLGTRYTRWKANDVYAWIADPTRWTPAMGD